MAKKKKMKDKRNEEMLELITAVIQQYDDLGIVADSYLIGGQQIEYNRTPTSEVRIPSALSLYCTGFLNSEIVDSDRQVLLKKYQLINESANELYIDKSLGIKQSDESVKTSALRITGFKEPVDHAVRNPIGIHSIK
jgi:hypothetical protein